jgi:hypothetical protein
MCVVLLFCISAWLCVSGLAAHHREDATVGQIVICIALALQACCLAHSPTYRQDLLPAHYTLTHPPNRTTSRPQQLILLRLCRS